jgi:hypothetical protein
MSKCEICGNKIGLFSERFKTSDKKIICQSCTSNVDPVLLWSEETSAKDVANFMDNSIGDNYLHSIGAETPSDIRRKKEAQAKVEREKIAKEEAEHARNLAMAKEIIKHAKSQEISHFKVHGITYHELSKMVNYARKNDMFDPYDGYSAAEIKEYSPYERVFETDLSGIISSIEFVPEPENKYDNNAIKILATLDNKKYMIGYVPAKKTKEIADILEKHNNEEISLRIEYDLTGGKFKIADDDENDFSDDPKLKIHTGKSEYGFNIRLFDNNI